MEIYWFLLIAAIVPAMIVAIIYQSRLQEMAESNQEDINRRNKASTKKEHDFQALSAKNLELLGELEKVRAKIAGIPARVEEYKTKAQDAIRMAEGLGEEKKASIANHRKTEQQLLQAQGTQDVAEKARDQLKVDLKKSTLRSENLQLKLAEEQHDSEAKLEETNTAIHEEQHRRRDALAELLFLQHHFGEAGIVARRHWQSADPQDFSKEPFEHEADLAVSAELDHAQVNGECCDHLAAKDDRETLPTSV